MFKNKKGESVMTNFNWIPELPKMDYSKPFYKMSDVEKKIYKLKSEKFNLIAQLQCFKRNKVYKYAGCEYIKLGGPKKSAIRNIYKSNNLLRLKGINEEVSQLQKENQ